MLKKDMQETINKLSGIIDCNNAEIKRLKKEIDDLHTLVDKQIDLLESRSKKIEDLQSDYDCVMERFSEESMLVDQFETDLKISDAANTANKTRIQIQRDIISKLMKLAEVED